MLAIKTLIVKTLLGEDSKASFSVLTLLVGLQEEQPAFKNFLLQNALHENQRKIG